MPVESTVRMLRGVVRQMGGELAEAARLGLFGGGLVIGCRFHLPRDIATDPVGCLKARNSTAARPNEPPTTLESYKDMNNFRGRHVAPFVDGMKSVGLY